MPMPQIRAGKHFLERWHELRCQRALDFHADVQPAACDAVALIFRRNVVAADEWAENVDNNAFTNAAAKAVLQDATEAAKLLGIAPNPDWALVAANIPVLKFPDGVTKEHAGYHGEGIKQADVTLLAYPLKEVTDPQLIRKDLEYYETRVPNEGTPAMTQAIFALLYARLGDGEKAFHFFKDAYLPNLNPPLRVIAETKGGTNPYFATGAGAIGRRSVGTTVVGGMLVSTILNLVFIPVLYVLVKSALEFLGRKKKPTGPAEFPAKL